MGEHGGHAHGPRAASPEFRSAAQRNRGRLLAVFAVTLVFAGVEVVGGLLTNSVALLADAGHMLTDCLGLGTALAAVWLAGRPRSDVRSYGYYRLEIVAALINGLLLLAASGYVIFESARRMFDAPNVAAEGMMVVAAAGLAVNLAGLALLASGAKESLNVRGAYLEVLGDAVGSVAVVVAGALLLVTGWDELDPLAGGLVGAFMITRTWRLLREAVHVLMEGTPSHISSREVEEALTALPNVRAVHDLHIWAITSGMDVLSCHLVVDDPSCGERCLAAVGDLLRRRFAIDHMTVQVEGPEFAETGPPF